MKSLIILVWLTLMATVFAAAPELRQWTSQSGAKVNAKFVEQNENQVVLEGADGKKFAIRLDKLSPQDQEYIRSLAKLAAPAAGVPAPAGGPLAVDPAGKWKAGTVSGAIECKKDSQWSYLLYVPKTFDPKRKWPVLFISTQTGGTAAELNLFVPGAELCGWILATCPQVKRDFFDSDTAFRAMAEDVLARLPIDPQRVFVAGYLDGSVLAVTLAGQRKEPPVAGLLLINSGPTEYQKVSSATAAYGLCGATAGYRGIMAQAFRELRGANGHLRLFDAANEWPAPELILDSLVWLNYASLQAAPPMDQALLKEKKVFAKKMEDEILRLKDSNPERAYDWAEALTGSSKLVPPQMSALLNHPKVKLYVAGQKELQRLLKKYLAAKGAGSDLGKAGDAEAKKLAETYKDCRLGEVFSRLQQLAIVVPPQ